MDIDEGSVAWPNHKSKERTPVSLEHTQIYQEPVNTV